MSSKSRRSRIAAATLGLLLVVTGLWLLWLLLHTAFTEGTVHFAGTFIDRRIALASPLGILVFAVELMTSLLVLAWGVLLLIPGTFPRLLRWQAPVCAEAQARYDRLLEEIAAPDFTDRHRPTPDAQKGTAVAAALGDRSIRRVLERHGAGKDDLQALYCCDALLSVPHRARALALANAAFVDFFLTHSESGDDEERHRRLRTDDDRLLLHRWAAEDPGGQAPPDRYR